MNEYQKKLIASYKSKVKYIGEKTAAELDCYLKKQDFIKTVSFHRDIPQLIQDYTMQNFFQNERYLNFSPKIKTPSFYAYKIINTGLGEKYYCGVNCDTYVEFNDGTKGVYLVIEKNTAFISGNSGRLVLELMIERGIDAYDYENNTLALFEYLSRIDALEKFFKKP